MGRFLLIVLAVGIAFLTRYLNIPSSFEIAQGVSHGFVNLLKLIVVPTVFLSILSTISGFSKFRDVRNVIGGAVFYSLFTTLIAVIVGLGVYVVISPASGFVISEDSGLGVDMPSLGHDINFLTLLPDNFVRIFLDNNIIGCIGVSFLLGAGCLLIDDDQRELLNKFFTAIFEVFLRVAGFITCLMPIAVWGFVATFLFMHRSQDFSFSLMKYVLCLLLSDAIQSIIILPVFLKVNGIKVIPTLKGVLPALATAFFSRSSLVTLPVTIKCVNENLGEPKNVSSFTLPLCATINMNGCAIYIFVTGLFMCEVNSHIFSVTEITMWALLAIGGAVANAGVPMGCFFMTASFLVALKVPLHVMGLLMPLYALTSMSLTTLNVWSDICITRVMSKRLKISG